MIDSSDASPDPTADTTREELGDSSNRGAPGGRQFPGPDVALPAPFDPVPVEAADPTPITPTTVDGGSAAPAAPERRAPVFSTPMGASAPFAMVSCLAGFLDEATLGFHIPTLTHLPSSLQGALRQRVERAATLPPYPRAGRPQFTPVTESSVLQLLEHVAGKQEPRASLDNLLNFEWVEIAPLLAGHLVTDREPPPETHPRFQEIESVARFCVLAGATLGAPTVERTGAGPVRLLSPVATHVDVGPIGLQPVVVDEGREGLILTVHYILQPAVDPIRVFVVDGRAIAVSGLGRLVVLLRAGITRALCKVLYGYGVDSLSHLPTTPTTLLEATRPPVLADFLDQTVTVAMPVRSETTVISAHVDTARIA